MATNPETVETPQIDVESVPMEENRDMIKSCLFCVHSKVCAPYLSAVETKNNYDAQFKPMKIELNCIPEGLALKCPHYLRPQAGGFLR